MKIIFVGAVVLSLVVMISSQDITLTPQDATCIQNEALSSETDILQACSADELAWLAQGDVSTVTNRWNVACIMISRLHIYVRTWPALTSFVQYTRHVAGKISILL